MNKDQINEKLLQIQESSLNSGGYFQSHLIKKENNFSDCLTTLKIEFQKIERYNNPTSDGKYFESRDLNSIELTEIQNWELELRKEIKHWTNFELIDKTTINRYNQTKIDEAERELIHILKSYSNDFRLFTNHGKFDSNFAIWGDHINKDLYFDFMSYVLVIHFGWSS